jgi:4-diphosphocytidyl-2-C-methyl-D-erythritol kinase
VPPELISRVDSLGWVASVLVMPVGLVVVGPVAEAGKHEVLTVYQRVTLADRVTVEPAHALTVEGFAGDTIVRRALSALAAAAGVEPGWRVRLQKRIPVSAGLAGGSSDAATALRLAAATLPQTPSADSLHRLAAELGADVPFFLTTGPQLGSGDGARLEPLRLPQDYAVLLVLPHGLRKESTAAVYRAFDERRGAEGYEQRRGELLAALEQVERAADLALLPRNDLASSPLARGLEELGAFRADVSGAGPAVYALFRNRADAVRAARRCRSIGRTIVTVPCWYG